MSLLLTLILLDGAAVPPALAACEQACPLALQDAQGCCPVDYQRPAAAPPAPPAVQPLREESGPVLKRHQQLLLELPSGVYEAGSPIALPGRRDDEVLHGVAIGAGVLMGREEVTRGLFAEVMGLAAPPEEERALPMTGVRWLDAVTFCNLLSDAEALSQVYAVSAEGVAWNKRADGYRLPTEAEWEYAARAGGDLRWAGTDEPGSLCAFANITPGGGCDDGVDGPAPVRSYAPNAWGFHDLSGNVAEWTWDWYGPYAGEVEDPRGPTDGALKVVRGGSWWLSAEHARASRRYWAPPDQSDDNLGFRVARGEPDAP